MNIARKPALAIGVVGLLCLLPFVWYIVRVAGFWFLVLLASFEAIDRGAVRRSGIEKIPQVRQIESLFGKGDHAVSNGQDHFMPGGANDVCQWSTEVYFGGRYQLTMWADIEVDRRTSELVRVIGTPKFQVHEIERLDIPPGGSPGMSFANEWNFSAEEWQKVFEADGDFSVIGIQLTQDAEIAGFDRLVKWSRARARGRYAR